MKIQMTEVGVACYNKHSSKHPYLMTETYRDKTFEEAKVLFLADPSVANSKLNDDVMLLRTGVETYE